MNRKILYLPKSKRKLKKIIKNYCKNSIISYKTNTIVSYKNPQWYLFSGILFFNGYFHYNNYFHYKKCYNILLKNLYTNTRYFLDEEPINGFLIIRR